jgi:hypothetical protein
MITDAKQFEALVGELQSLAETSHRLPERIFRGGYSRFQFIEFDRTMSESFWNFLQPLAVASGGSVLNAVILEPDPIAYFAREFGVFGGIQLSTADSASDYYDALAAVPQSSPADAFIYNSRVVAWFPDSGQWLLWGERGIGIAVLGLRDGFDAAVDEMARAAGLPILSLGGMLELAAVNFKDAGALKEFAINLSAGLRQ